MQKIDLIKKNVETVRDRIARACVASGRSPGEVALCAVTKNRSAEDIRCVLAAGVLIIGENRVQEADTKIAQVETRGFALHLIGHLQTNKAARAAELFDTVESVDSLRLARVLDAESARRNKVLDVFVQVNSSGEDSKSGLAPEEFVDEAQAIAGLDHLNVCGVMTIGPLTDDADAVDRAFALTQGLFEELRKRNPGVARLSMGMTGDLEAAVARGATQVRVGRALFDG